MHALMHLQKYAHVCIHMCIHIHVYIHVCVHIYTFMCVHLSLCTYVYVWCVCICMYTFVWVYLYAHVYIHMCVCVCVHDKLLNSISCLIHRFSLCPGLTKITDIVTNLPGCHDLLENIQSWILKMQVGKYLKVRFTETIAENSSVIPTPIISLILRYCSW